MLPVARSSETSTTYLMSHHEFDILTHSLEVFQNKQALGWHTRKTGHDKKVWVVPGVWHTYVNDNDHSYTDPEEKLKGFTKESRFLDRGLDYPDPDPKLMPTRLKGKALGSFRDPVETTKPRKRKRVELNLPS